MDPLHAFGRNLTRRHFFGLTSTGIGTAVLASLLNDDLRASVTGRAGGPAALRAQGQTRHLPVPVGRAVADGAVRLQAQLREQLGARTARIRFARANGLPA